MLEGLGVDIEHIHDMIDEFLGQAHTTMMDRTRDLVEVNL